MAGEIPGLAGSVLCQTAAELYRRHDGAEICAGCGGRFPCAVRQHAALVLVACGASPAVRVLPDHVGYAVGRVRGARQADVYDRS